MGRFTKIPQSAFDDLQMDAGILLNTFNPANPNVQDSHIITATTGGINITCTPTYSDFGEDVDNCPNNVKELKHLDGWECGMSFTALGATENAIKLALGAFDKDNSTGAIKPRRTLSQADFTDLWWVGDKANGGFVAVKLLNALSTDGFNLQTTKNGKGQLSVSITGHVSINNQDVMPMEFYAIDPGTYTVTQTLTHMYSTNPATAVTQGSGFYTKLSEQIGYSASTVTVTMGGTNITSTAYTASTGEINIAEVTGNLTIVATASAES